MQDVFQLDTICDWPIITPGIEAGDDTTKTKRVLRVAKISKRGINRSSRSPVFINNLMAAGKMKIYMPPVTPSTWKTTKLADRFGAVCPQRPPDIGNRSEALLEFPRGRLLYLEKLLPLLANQSEDCLYLNIYVPRAGCLVHNTKCPQAMQKRHVNINTINRTPWFTPKVKELAKQKKNTYIKYARDQTLETWNNYRRERNEASAKIRELKENCWEKFTKRLERDRYGIWKPEKNIENAEKKTG
ncbi:hypothetical protein YQE_02110, partial [Dendroctonus ponderosae]